MEPDAFPSEQGARRHIGLAIALGVGLLVGLANLAKPVHIDDTLYVSIARWITAHPFDPYGGTLNWQQVPERTYNVSISPPLLSYYFAVVMLAFGENLLVLHASMIPWSLLACWALYRLGERWAGAGISVVLLVVSAPAVVVGLNLMLDVPLLACICASIEWSARGVEQRSGWRAFILSGLFGTLAVLIKLPGLVVVPIVLVAAVQGRRWQPLLAASLPVVALAAWQTSSRMIYGLSQVNAGLSFLDKMQSALLLLQPIERTIMMTAILAMTFPLWLGACFRTRGFIGATVAAVASTAIAAALQYGIPANRVRAIPPYFLPAVFLGTFGLMRTLVPLPRVSLGTGRPALDPRPMLYTWLAAGSAVVIFFGPFVAVRSFLPVQPPLAILLVLGLDPPTRRRMAVMVMVMCSAAVSAGLAWTDWRWAATYPIVAEQVHTQYGESGRPLFFRGHWGWQYYAELHHLRAWDARQLDVPNDAILIVPLRADKQIMLPRAANHFRLYGVLTVRANELALTTWNVQAGLRFYGGDYGQLPWGFSREPTERFLIYEAAPP